MNLITRVYPSVENAVANIQEEFTGSSGPFGENFGLALGYESSAVWFSMRKSIGLVAEVEGFVLATIEMQK